MRAVAILYGPGLVIRYRNAEMEDLVDRPGIGLPLREVYPEPEYRPLIAFLELAYQHKTALRFAATTTSGRPGVITVHHRNDGTMAVTWAPVRSPLPRPVALVR